MGGNFALHVNSTLNSFRDRQGPQAKAEAALMSGRPTPRDYAGIHTVHAVCPHCERWAKLDLAALVAAGQGDISRWSSCRCVAARAAGPGTRSKSAAVATDWRRRSPSLACLPAAVSPCFPPCSSSPKPMPPRSAPHMSRRASCRPPSSCVGCSPGSPTTPGRWSAPGPSPAGNRCPRRLVRLPGYPFVGAGLGPRPLRPSRARSHRPHQMGLPYAKVRKATRAQMVIILAS
jgi:hypothetical protein